MQNQGSPYGFREGFRDGLPIGLGYLAVSFGFGILAVAAGTQLTRWLPFWLFPEKKEPPAIVTYLGRVLPDATMGLLVVYCLKDVTWLSGDHGLPQILAILTVAVLLVLLVIFYVTLFGLLSLLSVRLFGLLKEAVPKVPSLYRNELLPEMESQFAAVTWLLPGGSALITYRGTDTTLTGWKEDFNMSFQTCVPAQEKALWYLEAFAKGHPTMPILVAGHSKGGNMAVYAAARCQPELQARLTAVHNHDGPGFQAAILREPGYREVLTRVRTFVPQSSVVGMLLEHEESYTVVRSRQLSLLQHDPYSWEVLGGDFICLEEVDENSRFLDGTIKTWLGQTSLQERNDFVDAVFELLTLGEIDDLRDVILPKNVLRYLRQLRTDEKMRSIIAKVFADLFRAAVEQRKRKEPAALPERNVQS